MDMDVANRRLEALASLKPMCITLMQDCSKDNIKTFISALSGVRSDVAQEIQQYILFPLQNAIHQKNLSESSFCAVCLGVDAVLDKTTIQTAQVFMDIFNPLVLYLSSSSNPSQVSAKAEETKAAAVKSLSSLIKSSSNSVLSTIYSLNYLPAIGQLISLLLTLAEVERSRSLQIASMECLVVVMHLQSKYGSTREVQLGNFFAFCLPGITMAMSRIIAGDQKQGSEVIRKAMSVWSGTVCLVLSDRLLEQSRNTALQKTPDTGHMKQDKLRALMVDRDEEWVKTTASKLSILIGQICKLGSHSNWRVRLSLAELAESLLVHCSNSLSANIPKILESLVGLISDEYDKVATKAFSVLQTFSDGHTESPGERSLTEILEDNIYNLATSLPRQIRMCDEEDKLPLINLLKGYITLLGPRIRCVVNSSSHLRHLALALVQALELDASDTKILEERATLLDYESETFHGGGGHSVWIPKKYFRHFRDEKIESGLTSVCRLLGRYGNLYMLVDCFLDLFHESCVYRLASVFIINQMVYGASLPNDNHHVDVNSDTIFCQSKEENDASLIQDVVRMLLDEYVCTVSLQEVHPVQPKPKPVVSSSSLVSSLDLALTSSSSHEQDAASVASHNKEILLGCLFMEGVGKFALVLGQKFGVHLIQTLYPLVENLGHQNIHISSTAYLVLTQICEACQYRSIDALIQTNADYLINSVSLRLRHFSQNRRTPRLLCVMLRYCSMDILPLVDHSIGEILDTLDDHYTQDLVLFMPVLMELTSAIGRWFPATTPAKNKKPKHDEDASRPLSIALCLEDYVRLKALAEGDWADDEGQGEATLGDIEEDFEKLREERKREKEAEEAMEEDREEEDSQKECPRHIQVVKEVFARIKNLLSSHDARVRVQSLEIVAQGCRDLADHERELLPQIHQVWPGFYPRFHSEEKFVVIKALHTLRVMADTAGSFILHRVTTDVLPGLAQFMDKQANISCESRSTYVNTSSFKLQLAILEVLGPLAETLELDGNNLDAVAKICLPYLSHLQPEKLQKASASAFSSFVHLDSDAVWLLLCLAYCPCHYDVPGTEFAPLPKSFQVENENCFTKNVKEIFQAHSSL